MRWVLWMVCGCTAAGLACSTARPLRPLHPGQWAAEVSLPAVWIAKDDLSYPLGAPVVGMRYGLPSQAEGRFRMHPLPLLARGILAVEGGGVWHLRSARGLTPGVHATADLSLVTRPASYRKRHARLGDVLRGAADVSVVAHVELLGWLWPYVVYDNALILADGTWVPSLIGGAQLHIARRWELSIEAGWAAFTDRTDRRTQSYASIRGHGGIWSAAAITYRLAPPTEDAP